MSKGYAIITGAARGLGKAIFLQLAKEGYDLVGVYATDTSTPKMQALIEALRACPLIRHCPYIDSLTKEWKKCQQQNPINYISQYQNRMHSF